MVKFLKISFHRRLPGCPNRPYSRRGHDEQKARPGWEIYRKFARQYVNRDLTSLLLRTVEPLSKDHPHQRPSLLYDHILCDGQCFLFVRSLTNDHPSDATNDRVRWDFLPRERPPRLQCISKNHGWRFNIRTQPCIITMLCL